MISPLLEILYQATHSKIQAVVLDMFPIGCLVFGTISIATTSSRLTFAFARDNGLPLSPHLAKISNGVPRNSLFLTIIIDVFFGLLYFVSDSALHAILSASVVALGISYGLPIFTLLLRGRSFLPKAAFSLGRWGLFVNYLGLSFILLTTILFLFPAHRVVDASSMSMDFILHH
ncbi:Choline transport protein [Neolecta irregularis DAH-3]|uniref:Choline transport protein n=1 Tax=Neolecta irregularis (strain DAH-3) TaxID=1198029 RepID=A0A1U7LTJ8_NEOID|nr:Choline transport protein [Neolecta irregularis DAH-3]|eukprot:OLL25841.1 Choline transport protein [Neolecta irregularis DAH-3]